MKHQSTIRILVKGLAMGSLAFSLRVNPLQAQVVQTPSLDDILQDFRATFAQIEASSEATNLASCIHNLDNSNNVNLNAEQSVELVDCFNYLNDIVQSFPDGHYALYHRGLVRLKMGDYQAASSDIKQALSLYPGLRDMDEFKYLNPLPGCDVDLIFEDQVFVNLFVSTEDNIANCNAYGTSLLDAGIKRFIDLTRQYEAATSADEHFGLERELADAALRLPPLVIEDLSRYR